MRIRTVGGHSALTTNYANLANGPDTSIILCPNSRSCTQRLLFALGVLNCLTSFTRAAEHFFLNASLWHIILKIWKRSKEETDRWVLHVLHS